MKTIYLLLSLLISFSLFGNDDIPETTVKFSITSYPIGGETYLSMNYENYPGWHTYWQNPGDSGLKTEVFFFVDGEPFAPDALEWPAPQNFLEEGDILAYGYKGSYSFIFKISEELFEKIKNRALEIRSQWLACKHICIPGKKEIKGILNDDREFVGSETPDPDLSAEDFKDRLLSLPKKVEFPSALDLVLSKEEGDNQLALFINLSDVPLENLKPNRNLLTPFPHEPFSFKREKLFKDKEGTLYGKLEMEWDGEYSEPPQHLPQDGKFPTPRTLKFLFSNPYNGKTEVLEKTFAAFTLTDAKRLDAFFELLEPVVLTTKAGNQAEDVVVTLKKDSGILSLLYFILLAFIGGLILNIMPCVLPVISLKLFGLIKHRELSRGQIFKHNLFYTFGVLFSFAVLATVVMIIKSAGEGVGWGFQLQSPTFVTIMIVTLFVFALNLFGLFEVITPGGSKLGGIKLQDSLAGDFFSGILATVLSTPCSAPFLGTALAFAFTSSTSSIFIVFIFIGVGLAFPFILTGIFPSLISFLPKPGDWMEHLKKFLGLALLLTLVWLYDVFFALTNSGLHLLYLNLGLLFIFFLFTFRKSVSKKGIYTFIFLLISLLFFGLLIKDFNTKTGSQTTSAEEKIEGEIIWEKWSQKRMDEYKDAKELVFIDFTAKWCLTCKVNEKLILNTDSFKELVIKNNMKLLLADWTKRDPQITLWLKEHNLAGVPAYFIQKPSGELIPLGETITIGEIEENL